MTNLIEKRDQILKDKIPARYSDVNLEEVSQFEMGKSYYIWGGVGTGKTRIAYGIVKRGIEKTYELAVKDLDGNTGVFSPIKFYNFPKMLMYIKNGIGADKKYLDTLNIVEIAEEKNTIIIDDIGSEKFTEWTIETLYQIINERYENMLPIIFVSNLSLADLAGKVGDRISSRIAEMCEVIKLDGKDRRI
mgnify:CR=1 FL=1